MRPSKKWWEGQCSAANDLQVRWRQTSQSSLFVAKQRLRVQHPSWPLWGWVGGLICSTVTVHQGNSAVPNPGHEKFYHHEDTSGCRSRANFHLFCSSSIFPFTIKTECHQSTHTCESLKPFKTNTTTRTTRKSRRAQFAPLDFQKYE